MTQQDTEAVSQAGEPTAEGWYRTRISTNWLLYSLCEGKWYAHAMNGETVACTWPYIEQAGPLEFVASYPTS